MGILPFGSWGQARSAKVVEQLPTAPSSKVSWRNTILILNFYWGLDLTGM
jgi:hypothetical protein